MFSDTILKKVLEIDSSHVRSRLLLALLYEKNKLYKKAIHEYKAALGEQETLVNIMANLSVLYNRMGLVDESRQEMEKAIQIAHSAKIDTKNLKLIKKEIK